MGAAMRAQRVTCQLALVLALTTSWNGRIRPHGAANVTVNQAVARRSSAGLVRMSGRNSIAWYGGSAV